MNNDGGSDAQRELLIGFGWISSLFAFVFHPEIVCTPP